MKEKRPTVWSPLRGCSYQVLTVERHFRNVDKRHVIFQKSLSNVQFIDSAKVLEAPR